MFKYLSAILALLLASPISFAESGQSGQCAQAAREFLDANPEAVHGDLGVVLSVMTQRHSVRYFAAGVHVIEYKYKDGAENSFSKYTKVVRVADLTPEGASKPGGCDGDLIALPMTPEEVVHYKNFEDGLTPGEMAKLLDRYGTGLIEVAALVDNNQGPGSANDEQLTSALAAAESCKMMGEAGEVQKVDGYSETRAIGLSVERGTNEIGGPSRYFKRHFSYMNAMVGPACMLKATGARIENFKPEDLEPAAIATVSALEEMANGLENHGNTIINGKNSTHFSVPVEWSDNTDGIYTQINRVHAFVDPENYVYTRRRFEGEMTSNGETRSFFLEKDFDDYRIVPNSNNALYEPYHHILRMGGILGAAERAKMQEAKAKLDEFEKQLAAMPASQRQMMESMMGDKMEQFRTLADDGTFEFEYFTTEIIVNPDFSANTAASALPTSMPNLVQIIQQHLVTLGYDPGKTDGELIKQTVVAITQFEAANHMPVTGEATPQLAGILAAAVDAQE